MRTHIIFTILALSITACEGGFFSNKVPLEGERIEIKPVSDVELFSNLESPSVGLSSKSPVVANGYFYNYQNSSLQVNDYSSFKKVFSVKSNSSIISNNVPVVLNDKIIVMDAVGKIYSYDFAGKEIWRNNFFSSNNKGFLNYGNKYFSGGMLFHRGVVYAVAGTNQIVAINAESGEAIWDAKVNGVLRVSPVISDDVILVQAIDNKVFALDVNTGLELWFNFTAPTETTTVLNAPAISHKGNFYVQYNSGELMAMQGKTGKVLWEADNTLSLASLLSQDSSLGGSMNMLKSEETIFFVDKDNTLQAVDINSGAIKWSLKINAVKGLWLAGKYIYVLDSSNKVYAVHKNKGKAKWSVSLDELPANKDKYKDKHFSWTPPKVINGKVVLVSSFGHWLELGIDDGKLSREIQLKHGIPSAPVVANGKIVFVDNNGGVYISVNYS